MKILKITIISAALITLITCQAMAFYQEAFIKMKNGPGFQKNNIFTGINFNYFVHTQGAESSESWELTPSIGYAFTEWMFLGFGCVLGKYGSDVLSSSKAANNPNGTSLLIDSIILDLVFGVTKNEKVPVELGIDIFYRAPTYRSEDYLNRKHCFGFTFILGESFGSGHNLTLNITYAHDGDIDRGEWASGGIFQVAQSGNAIFKAGIEFWGDFDGHSAIVPGVYVVINSSLSIKAGVFVGLSQYTDEYKNDGNKEDDYMVSLSMAKMW